MELKPWYKYPLDDPDQGNQLARVLFDTVSAIEENQSQIQEQASMLMTAYSGRNDTYFTEWTGHIVDSALEQTPNPDHSENIIATVCDTIHTNITKSKVKATPVVKKGSFSLYRSGRQLDQFLYGLFTEQMFSEMPHAFMDCELAHVGAIKITLRDKDNDEAEFCIERVHPDEIVVDQKECLSTLKPRCVYHRRLVHREVVAEWIEELNLKQGEKEELLEKVTHAQLKGKDDSNTAWKYSDKRTPIDNDLLIVIEGYYEGFSKKTSRHIVAIENATIVYEDWPIGCHPFIFLRWKEPRKGFYGYPLAEEVLPYQLRLNQLNDKIKESTDLCDVPRIFVQGKVEQEDLRNKIDNTIAKVYTYKGDKPPICETWQGPSNHMLNEREREIRRAHEQVGLSQLSSQATLPDQARLDSSKALREYSLIENKRYALQAQRYEQAFLDAAKLIIDIAAASGKKIKVRVYHGSGIREIDWSEIKLSKDDYQLMLEPSSVLNMTPAARKDEINSLVTSGMVTPDTAMYLLHHSDLELVLKYKTAARDAIESHVDMLLDGKPVTPFPEMDLNLAIELVTAELNHLYEFEDTPEDILNLFQAYLSQCSFWLKQSTPPPIDLGAQLANVNAQPSAVGIPADPSLAGIPNQQPVF